MAKQIESSFPFMLEIIQLILNQGDTLIVIPDQYSFKKETENSKYVVVHPN